MSADSTANVIDVPDTLNLIEDESSVSVLHCREEYNLEKFKLKKDKASQRWRLLGVAMFVPFLKFVSAMSVLFELCREDVVGQVLENSKDQFAKERMAYFVYCLMILPVALITLGSGCLLFTQFPMVATTAVNGYVGFRSVILSFEVVTWILILTDYSYTPMLLVAIILFSLCELSSIIFVKIYYEKHGYNPDPVEQPGVTAFEMDTIKTNMTTVLKPVPCVALGNITEQVDDCGGGPPPS